MIAREKLIAAEKAGKLPKVVVPMHMQPYYQEMGFDVSQFPQAEQYYQEAISIPMFPTMTEYQQDKLVAVLGELLL